ncbi:MAG: hypothetical protein A2Y10_07110 [Planctomycetes bacterium GWF2_41_51]|nr:MAG: hypothetical protein A2Y10_07110 [Planctomycetes bacterium GWF2_41_51]HBG28766.1 hypothetical protein [Phycisphaerales bacterium]
MKKYFSIIIAVFASQLFALEPSQILIIANADVNESVQVAEYYCQKRAVPLTNILKIPLGKTLSEQMSRKAYDHVLASAVRKEIQESRKPYEIKCLLTVYGVPIKVGSADALKDSEKIIPQLTEVLTEKNKNFDAALDRLATFGRAEMVVSNQPREKFEDVIKSLNEKIKQAEKRIQYLDNANERTKQLAQLSELSKNIIELANSISRIKTEIDKYKGVETFASIDSELSMVLFDNYDLYRWQENELKDSILLLPSKTLMVARLDGPSEKIASRLIDKAIASEKNGLSGNAYIDARGMNISGQLSKYSYEFYDKNLNTFHDMLKNRTAMNVIFENTSSLFAPNSCPNTAIYCGWYSVKKYIDSFEFASGAIGYHIASFEAMDLRNASSSNWCPSMLTHGITATLGPVNEPYLHSFPLPTDFFGELLDGKCLVEAYFRTNPYNSWQLVLIGDPLYKIKIK